MPSFMSLTTSASIKLTLGSTPPTSINLPRGPIAALLSFPRSDSSGHLLRKNLHFQKENQPKYRSRGSSRGHQEGRRRYLAGKLYGL